MYNTKAQIKSNSMIEIYFNSFSFFIDILYINEESALDWN